MATAQACARGGARPHLRRLLRDAEREPAEERGDDAGGEEDVDQRVRRQRLHAAVLVPEAEDAAVDAPPARHAAASLTCSKSTSSRLNTASPTLLTGVSSSPSARRFSAFARRFRAFRSARRRSSCLAPAPRPSRHPLAHLLQLRLHSRGSFTRNRCGSFV